VTASNATQVRAFPGAGTYAGMALAFIAFAVYGSLIPFDLRPVPLDSAWAQFRSVILMLPSGRVSRSDLLANLLLFVPVGFTLSGALLIDRKRWWAIVPAAFVVVAVSVVVSSAAEFLQLFTSGRVPSGRDIAAQTIGCVIGMLAWAVSGQSLTMWLRATLAAAPGDRLSRVVAAYAAAWLFVNLAPFDITVDLGDLADGIRSGRITLVPFGGAEQPLARRMWDALAETLSAVPLGLTGLIASNTGRSRFRPPAYILGAAMVALTEVAQIFIQSHAADSADAAFGFFGVAVGVWLGRGLVPRLRSEKTVGRPRAMPLRALSLMLAWCVVLCVYHWLPYDFTIDSEAIKSKVARISLLPFASYATGSYLNAFNDLLTKLALAAPLGLSAAFVARGPFASSRIVAIATILMAGGVFTVIETGQLFLPTRSPDLTDVLVGMTGTAIGLTLGRWLKDTR